MSVLPAPLDHSLFPASLYRTGNPHAVWREMRTEPGLTRQDAPDGTPFFSATRYVDVLEVLRDNTRFTSEHSTMLSSLHGDAASGIAINLIDGPRQRLLRGAGMRLLAPSAVRRHARLIGERATALIKSMLDKEVVDLAEEMSVLPMLVTAEIVGLPSSTWASLVRWTMASIAPDDPSLSCGTPAETLARAHTELLACFSELVDERRRAPRDDLISELGGLLVDGLPLSDEAVLVNVYAFVMGASITTPQVVNHLLVLMAEQPRLWEQVRDSGTTPSAVVDEALRWSTPTNHLLRRVTTETVVAGTWVRPGDLVAAWVASANRDESVFDDSFRFDPRRDPRLHLAFGEGRHVCVGAHVARTGLEVLISELIRTVERFELVDEPEHLASNFVSGITRLPMRLHPASRS